MQGNFLQLLLDTRKVILTSKSSFFKTESFIEKTKYVSNIDQLLSKLSETIVLNKKDIFLGEKEFVGGKECFAITTADNLFSFAFRFGYQVGGELNKHDIIFCDYFETTKEKSNLRVDEYLKIKNDISIIIKAIKLPFKKEDYLKLYQLSTVSGVSLPRLSREQRDIVETIDKNMLVQGVAGSGKTNICIDKIIFTACRNFTGKVLYTTFSRGLLVDTKLKVEAYKKDLEAVLLAYKSGSIVFLDGDHKKALENRLGIYFFSDDDNEIFAKVKRVIDYLEHKVDYLLIEDIYREKLGEATFVNQDYFMSEYSTKLSNHQIEKCFNKLSRYSKEIIYKEIYGMIFGFYSLDNRVDIMSLEDYITARENSFSRLDCETIYQIALDYKKHCEKLGLLDNNSASKKLIDSLDNDFEYSLTILDEVQDYTQVNLCLFKKLSLKLFCVGDALQMINPSYFSFGYLKNLLYEKDVTEVKELQFNYRNTAKIEEIISSLGEINKKEFGTHSFVVKGRAVDNGLKTTSVFIRGGDFKRLVADSSLDNFTFIVSSEKEKKELKKIIKNQEVLTVSEIKGLERSTVVVYNILSTNIDKWRLLDREKVNHKSADENSVFRYYYNLFYVGLSRAKQNIFVVENDTISQFEEFFKRNFDVRDSRTALKILEEIVSKVDFTQDEVLRRVEEFIRLEQFDNARFMVAKLKEDRERISANRKIEVAEAYIHYGKYREAGVKFWEYGMLAEAKEQFTLSGDDILIELIDKCSENNSSDLSIDIVKYFTEVGDNIQAKNFILETVKKDVAGLKSSMSQIRENFKKGRK